MPAKRNHQFHGKRVINQIVRRYAFYWRYDTPPQLALLNELWQLVNDRHNFLTPTKKPIGWATDQKGHHKRVYDDLATPVESSSYIGVRARMYPLWRESFTHSTRVNKRVTVTLVGDAVHHEPAETPSGASRYPTPTADTGPA